MNGAAADAHRATPPADLPAHVCLRCLLPALQWHACPHTSGPLTTSSASACAPPGRSRGRSAGAAATKPVPPATRPASSATTRASAGESAAPCCPRLRVLRACALRHAGRGWLVAALARRAAAMRAFACACSSQGELQLRHRGPRRAVQPVLPRPVLAPGAACACIMGSPHLRPKQPPCRPSWGVTWMACGDRCAGVQRLHGAGTQVVRPHAGPRVPRHGAPHRHHHLPVSARARLV